jgi:ribonuclease HI
METVDIFVDGAALPKNPGRGGAGVILTTEVRGLRHTRAWGFYLGEPVTNNAAELKAVILALNAIKRPCHVNVYSDSQYVVKTMTDGWKKGANTDLWAELAQAVKRHTVEWHWVKGHAGHELNEWANDLANRAAELGKDVIA